jgi:hypothetical protein
VHLEPFFLLARPKLAGPTTEVIWKATTTSADGVAAMTLTLAVAPDVIGIESLKESRSPATPVNYGPD